MSVQYCTIACDKGHITAHKLKLCEHSKYLQDILSKYPHAEHPIIILTELNIIDVKILVNYMYTGELVINTDSSPTSLLRAAQILKIDSLTAEDNEDEEQACDDSSESSNHHVADSSESSHHHVNESSPHNIYNNNSNNNNNNNINNNSNNSNNNNHHHHHHHLQDDMDDEDDEDEDDEDDLRMDDEDAGNSHSRLINSIKNIYSLNQNFHTSSPGLEQNLLGVASSNSNHQAQQFELDFGGNPKHNNNTPNSLSQHLQQQLSSHLDLQELQDSQDSKQIDKNNKIRCHLCNIGLSDVKCLYRHVLTRHLPEKWGYKCEFCDREFSRDDHLMRHYTTKHKNMEFDREKIRETRRLNREMAKNFHDQISTV